MWVLENLDSIFNCVQHAPLDLNLPTENDTLFMLRIQIEMMEKCGDHNSISFNATFNTNQNKVLKNPLYEVHKKINCLEHCT
jgi:hypothetical protein